MKRLGWGILTFIFSLIASVPAHALDTVPSAPNKVSGPLLIASYSLNGSNLRYVQVYNNSSNLVALDGWKIQSTSKTTPAVITVYTTLAGLLEPGKHVFAAVNGVVDRPTFMLPAYTPTATPAVATITLLAPENSGYIDETVTVPTITASSLKEVEGAANNYYLKRDVSATTGNYLSGFTFIVPTEKLKNDSLYVAPLTPLLQVVEIYPDAVDCSPFDTAALCSDYVKIQNVSTTSIDLATFRLRTGLHGQAATSSNTKLLTGSLESGRYASFPLTLSSTGSWVWLEDMYGSVKYESSALEYPSSSGHDFQAWAYDHQRGAWDWTTIPTPQDGPSSFPILPPVKKCTGLRISEIAANVATEDQFIELKNVAPEPLSIGGCVLQTNRSASASYVLPDLTLANGQYTTVYIKDTPLTLTKTTTGSVFILSTDVSTESDSVTYADLAEGTSYALIDGSWLQTFQITPSKANTFMEFALCGSGSVRNPETGLCNKVQALSGLEECGVGKVRNAETNRCRSAETISTLATCDSDQYRSPETNRCRSLAKTTGLLTPCASNQDRNPETNRCRSIDASNELKPCAANQERNPETNRCRAIGSSVATDFPVEAVAESGEATMGWWAFGGAGTLAAGYAGWEWRREVQAWIKKVIPFGIGRS